MLRVTQDTDNNQSNSIKKCQELVNRHEEKKNYVMATFIRAYAVVRYEFVSALKIGITIPIGFKNPFNFYGLNPPTLTKEQAQKRPTLLLNGACHNQGVWIYLARALQDADLGPFFTVNLSTISSLKDSFKVIDKKIDDIQQLYRQSNIPSVSVNMVGYSMGGICAYYTNLNKSCFTCKEKAGQVSCTFSYPLVGNTNIANVIFIGSVRNSSYMTNTYEIIGENDILAPPVYKPSQQKLGKQVVIDKGKHLDLISCPAVHRHIFQILSLNKALTPANDAKVSIDEAKSTSTVEVIDPKKDGCLVRFFSCKKDKIASSQSDTASPKSTLPCWIL